MCQKPIETHSNLDYGVKSIIELHRLATQKVNIEHDSSSFLTSSPLRVKEVCQPPILIRLKPGTHNTGMLLHSKLTEYQGLR